MNKFYNLLQSLINKVKSNESSLKSVPKTVNGLGPDENGNVEIPIPDHTWETLPDKPFGEVVYGDTLTWDGNTEGLPNIFDNGWHKVSDLVPTMDDFKNGVTVVWYRPPLNKYVENVCSVDDVVDENGFIGFGDVYVVYNAESVGAESTGIYFPSYDAEYVSSITIPGYGKFPTEVTTTIEPKYLPEALRFSATYGDTLTWDGNTEGLVSGGINLYKVSDLTPPVEELLNGGSYTQNYDGVVTEYKITEDVVRYDDGRVHIGDNLYVIYEADYDFEVPGIYFWKSSTKDNYITSLTIPGYGKFEMTKPLDAKYIPEHPHKWEDIENPPFGEEIDTIEILSKQTVYGTFKFGMYTAMVSMPEIATGYYEDDIVVTFDGAEYLCEAKQYNGNLYFGNLLLAQPNGDDTGEPFCVYIASTNRLVGLQDGDAHTISIYKKATITKTIDPKYLPDISETVDTAVTAALTEAKESGEFDGEPGAQGPEGPAGYTPVKGTDYYTEADKTEMVSRVLSALPTWNGGSY